jgi:hypothetical protein
MGVLYLKLNKFDDVLSVQCSVIKMKTDVLFETTPAGSNICRIGF